VALYDLLSGLNPAQRDAVTTTEGPLLVLAGAGTGKTRVVTVRIAYLLSRGVGARQILAVTFTNKAAREMHDRIEQIVGKTRARDLLACTFHSFAVRLLRAHLHLLGYRPGFTIADDEDQTSLLRDVLRQMGISEKELSVKSAHFGIGRWKNQAIAPAAAMEVACDGEEVTLAHVYERYAEEMRRRNTVDFDDMIMLAGRIFDEHPEVLAETRDRFRYLLVDEYQDTNASQYRLIKLLAGERRNLCVVGDDDQSIYGWRGARARNILDFAKDYRGAKVVTLDQNYRSVNVVLEAANSVIQNNPERSPKKLWSALGEGDPIVFFKAEDERDEELYVTLRIADLARRGVPYEHMAVLFRSNMHAHALELALRQRQIPYRVGGTRSFFDRRETRDLIAYLKTIANPRDDGALFRVINTPPRGIGRTTQDALIAEAVKERCGVYELIESGRFTSFLSGRTAEAVAEFRALMHSIAERAASSVHDALRELTERIAYRAFLDMEYREGMDAQIRWNTVEALMRVANTIDQRTPTEKLHAFLEVLALDQPREQKNGKEPQGVALFTVHAAKGLEFEHVYLVAVEDDVFPHKNSFDEETGSDTVDEERRLFYVALTRAKRYLTLSMAQKRTKWGRPEPRLPSRFVDEIAPKLLNVVESAKQGPAEEAVAEDFLARLKNLGGAKSAARPS
jgi:DNA helicase II / ATP-dependent DNA helicase PcrA